MKNQLLLTVLVAFSFIPTFSFAQNQAVSIAYIHILGEQLTDNSSGQPEKRFGLGLGYEKKIRPWLSWKNNLRYYHTEQKSNNYQYSYEYATSSSTESGTALFRKTFFSKAVFAQTGLSLKWDFSDGRSTLALDPSIGLMCHGLRYSNDLDYEFGFNSTIVSSDYYKNKAYFSPVWGIDVPYSYYISEALTLHLGLSWVSAIGEAKESIRTSSENDLNAYPPAIRQRLAEVREEGAVLQPLYAFSFLFGASYYF